MFQISKDQFLQTIRESEISKKLSKSLHEPPFPLNAMQKNIGLLYIVLGSESSLTNTAIYCALIDEDTVLIISKYEYNSEILKYQHLIIEKIVDTHSHREITIENNVVDNVWHWL